MPTVAIVAVVPITDAVTGRENLEVDLD